MSKLGLKDYISTNFKDETPAAQRVTVLQELLGGVLPGTFSGNALSSMRANIGRSADFHDQDEDEEVQDKWLNNIKKLHTNPSLLDLPQEENEEATEEEQERSQTPTKFNAAQKIFSQMINTGDADRKDIIDAMVRYADVTQSTAVSYYERIAKAAGLTNRAGEGDSEMVADDNEFDPLDPIDHDQQDQQGYGQQIDQEDGEPEELDPNREIEHTFPDDPNRQGIIRTVDKAHLVYKRQTPEGTFEELWIYNIGNDIKDDLSVRRNILSGTDIPAEKTSSPDGSQSYSIWTSGNAQLLCITGLVN